MVSYSFYFSALQAAHGLRYRESDWLSRERDILNGSMNAVVFQILIVSYQILDVASLVLSLRVFALFLPVAYGHK